MLYNARAAARPQTKTCRTGTEMKKFRMLVAYLVMLQRSGYVGD
jgi:hypothetical protein